MKKFNLFLSVLFVLILINGFGILLKIFHLPTFIILVGFRFHLSVFIILMFILVRKDIKLAASYLREINSKNIFKVIAVVLLPVLLLLGSLFLLKKISYKEPDFFYELGLSSIIDFPLYLIWNLPQLLIVYTFFKIIKDNSKTNYLWIFFSTILLFAFELIPMEKETFRLHGVYDLIAVSTISTILVLRIKNFYIYSFILFFTVWMSIILFGSTSIIVINFTLAKNFKEWQGFFIVDKIINEFVITIFYVLIIPFLFILKAREE